MTAAEINVHVLCDAWQQALPDLPTSCDKAARAALAAEGISADVAIVLVDDEHIQRLNAQFRHIDAPTNVLAFPSGEAVGSGEHNLGDIFLAYETTLAEAGGDLGSVRFADHVTHLVVHGTLHLLGFDHEMAADAAVMEQQEIAVLARLGVADPYAEAEMELGHA